MVNNLSIEDCAEIVKCSEDFSYFAKTYLDLFTDIDITLIERVTDAFDVFTDEEMIALLTWQCVFENHKRFCITSNLQDCSKKYLTQVIDNCLSLPAQFAPEIKTRLLLSAEFQNGNKIQIVTCNENSMRGMHVCTLVMFNSWKIHPTIKHKFLNSVLPIFQCSASSKLIMV